MAKDVMRIKYRGNDDTLSKDYGAWWQNDETSAHSALWANIDAINSLRSRQRVNQRNAFLYSRTITSSSRYPYKIGEMPRASSATFNVIKSVIDTVVAKVAKNKPKVQFLTDGGNWKQRQKAKKLTSYVNGVFQNSNVYNMGLVAFQDACIFGTGAIKVTRNKVEKRIDLERVPIDEVIVDDNDGLYGNPKTLYHVRYVNRWVLASLYPDHAEAIDAAQSVEAVNNAGSTVDLIPVAEGYRLPLKADRSDGRYIIATKDVTLELKPYRQTYFPFLFCRFATPITGFFAQGVCDELADIQREIDKLFTKITKSLDLVATPRVFLHKASGITKEQITNKVGHIVSYDGPGDVKPFFHTPTALNAEVYRHFQWLIESAFKRVGVSELSATSQKPAGLNAAVAIRTYQDIETERFYPVAQSYETLFLDAARVVVQESRELHATLKAEKKGGGLVVKGLINDREVESISWEEANLDDDQYVMKRWPTNLLPDRPDGKLQSVTELASQGILTQSQAQTLLDYPDLKAVQNVALSHERLVDKVLNAILYEGKYTTPEPYYQLDYAKIQAQNFYSMGKLESAPDSNLQLLLRFISEIERLEQIKANAAPKEAPPPLPAAPPATPIPNEAAPPIEGELMQ